MIKKMIRKLGKSGIEVSALGLGCWAIGGEFWDADDNPSGYGTIDDNQSVEATKKAIELGINFFDTADVYGAGHSERILGKAIKGHRSEVVIATKFGSFFNEGTKTADFSVPKISPGYIQRACEASLKRLDTDYIDLYQLHVWSIDKDKIDSVIDTFESLVKKGLIRTYGWSTDWMEGAQVFVKNSNCSAIQHQMNVFINAKEMLELCENNNLAGIIRSPLAMGLLSGKYDSSTKLPENDIRRKEPEWLIYFKQGTPDTEFLKKLKSIREILTSNGRTLAQGALAWIWGVNERTIPIPGFKSVQQVEENAGAIEFGPLTKDQMIEIDKLITRVPI
ncbi:MAG: aldo/keto reductase [Actinomycetota bacterium]|nr:aldo/keto reductase [Actinomycetota bacterium]